ncbi:MAG: thiamine pyrophosphate-dependent enzyme [Desulfarculaceae bacterium]|jgi:thiamine pyrophosphate-dependent acetolactate synthase large subunit-like protein
MELSTSVVGAWLARPDARPVGLFSDGGLGMNAGELETLVRLKVPPVYSWLKAAGMSTAC